MKNQKNNQSKNQFKGGKWYSSLLWALGAFETFILAICFAFVYGRIISPAVRTGFAIFFAVVAFVSFIIAVRKNAALKCNSNDYTKFPWLCFAFWAFVLLGITAIISALILKHLFAALIITIIYFLILAIIGMIKGWDRWHHNSSKPMMFFVFLIITLLIASLLISIIVVCIAPCNPCKDGHNFKAGECTVCGVDDPKYVSSLENPCKDGHDFKDGKCTREGCNEVDPNYETPVDDPCKDGHDFKDGKCTREGCDAVDPNYQTPVDDPCKDGHDFKDGKCTREGCEAVDPNYQTPVDDPCKDGHDFKDGKCTREGCEAVDPNYQAPVDDPCKDGHDFKDGKCTREGCDAVDPNYQTPVDDPCKDGHDFKDGKCAREGCDAVDPDYQTPVDDPCKDGHAFENGKCTREGCEAVDPDYVEPKFIDPPKEMKYGEPINIKTQGINVDNLIYGSKSFIEVKKVSDNEVMITLIMHSAGYITVTDYVSGVSIEITVVG